MKLKPSKGQLEYLDWEYGMFFHFGIRSFFRGHKDWDGIPMPAEAFDPRELDCEQWVKTAKEAGATYAILTAKHHDGFALWQSKYSNYGVAESPWKGGKGDVVKEFTDACRKYGLKVGLYYSPAQWGEFAIKFENEREYDDYFINQISELLGNYGKIDYLWFDGCGSEGHTYDHKRIVDEIFRLQPEILTFCDPEWFPCVRWVGNEDGYASLDNPLCVSKWDFSELSEDSVSLSQSAFLPAECDCKLRDTWFYDDNEESIKTAEELFGMYESSVGRGSNFLLNLSPDDRGLIPDKDRERVLELGERIKNNYSHSVELSPAFEDGDGSYSIADERFATGDRSIPKREMAHLVNTVVLSEDLSDGQSIKEFKLYAHLPHYNKKRILVFCGNTVGHKLICRFPTVNTPKLTVEITSSDGEYRLRDMKAYFVK